MPDIELVDKNREKDIVQVQFKDKNGYSKSFTVKGLGVDYCFGLFYTIVQKLTQTQTNNIQLKCYKPPKEGILNDSRTI